MADFESIIKNHAKDDGAIPATAINALATAIKTAVGNEYVEKERYKAKLTEIDALKEQQQTAEDNATTAEKWKTKYDALKSDFDSYKADQTAKETKAAKSDAYRALLKEAQVNEKRHDVILKCDSDKIDAIELDKDGQIKGKDKLIESVKAEWADFITTTTTTGAQTANPPANNGSVLRTKEDIYKKDEHGRYVLDANERQKAWGEIIAAQQQKG